MVRVSVGIGRSSSSIVAGTSSHKIIIGITRGPCVHLDMAICAGLFISGQDKATSRRSAKDTGVSAAGLLAAGRFGSAVPALLREHPPASSFERACSHGGQCS
jgi:hypothetical protein